MRPRVIAIVGATATGKTALAMSLARALGGEVVNADSRQVYRGMDIGTAKPTTEERAAVPHWLIDVADPDETFTLARFVDAARGAIADIAARGRQPIVVGGTGQYVWALVEGWRIPRVPPDPALRARYEALLAERGITALAGALLAADPVAAASVDLRNPRRIIRALEVTETTGRPYSAWRTKDPPPFDTTIAGLDMPRAALHRRADARVEAMVAAGLVDEVRRLNAHGYGCGLPAFASIGYREMCAHLRGELSLDEAVARIKTETHRLIRMQHAWFRRDDARIRWFDAASPSLADDVLAAVNPSAGDGTS
ncbi:MAG TPA: tRNA (adenosine(37)-N6)-dimethylallyltransferase MiaA [Dehalococcoidia bacterium]|nr:tRNA (adenosine(37)-N6)-dimethylallyltransferase MiaA [Dehalococcoidia bacterium]